MSPTQTQYDVAIIGAGVCGSALTYVLSQYTNIERIVLLEKCSDAAQVNSRVYNNSQTLHFGDIETNYTLQKAEKVNRAASLVKQYLLKYDAQQIIHSRYHKMVLAVGAEQVHTLQQRYHEFKTLFPALWPIDRAEIDMVEPNILKGRDPKIPVSALFTEEGYAVDYQKLARSFLDQVQQQQAQQQTQQDNEVGDRTVDMRFDTRVQKLEKVGDRYRIFTDQRDQTDQQVISAKTVVVAAGAYSLLFAKSLGYGHDYALLCVAGSFYRAQSALNGKVYTMQSKKLPFAAIHGDPEVHDPTITRFGPTAKVLPLLERYRLSTLGDYFKTAGLSLAAVLSFAAILLDFTVFSYICRNFLYDLPFIGKRLFIKEARRIVPSITLAQLEYAKGYGGLRPQIVNMKKRGLDMGEAKLLGDRIIFNITPSPGASTCLQTAEDDTERLITFLGGGYRFDKARFLADLGSPAVVVSS
ncbi:MAG: FAD-dependent oxidoreductase [Cyanothece sp. SIO2G6]|nr:FAD-dependent oxidoreductase [Cyanothece sp. SIO2G6]